MLWVLIRIASGGASQGEVNLMSTHNICFYGDYSLESPPWGDSKEYPQHVLWRIDENYLSIIIKQPSYLFHWIH